MSFFSELGAGLRVAAKEYNDFKREFTSIADDVAGSIKSAADETAGIVAGAKQTANDAETGIKSAAKAPVDAAKTIGGKSSIQ